MFKIRNMVSVKIIWNKLQIQSQLCTKIFISLYIVPINCFSDKLYLYAVNDTNELLNFLSDIEPLRLNIGETTPNRLFITFRLFSKWKFYMEIKYYG